MSEQKTWNRNAYWQHELEGLKELLATTELVETTKWGGIVYTLNGKNVLGLGGFKNYFTIWFFNGVFLKDELGVLVNANEGVTKGLRQWRFAHWDAVNAKEVLHYVQEAIANERAGLTIKPEKKARMECAYLDAALARDSGLRSAFERFTLSKQNEFLEYIATAKQEATKASRLEKIKPLILAGSGLNDRYKK
ncbi:MAG: hypothetical protein RL607_2001 [Bacteroidota bacterium]|jgi:uncharacterized protein YdeI (YjbR/CyaY-like superfamily)